MKKVIKYTLFIFASIVLVLVSVVLFIFFTFFYNQKYLVVLQNGGEARPGGGFFGSVALLDFDGLMPKIQINDAFKYQILAKEKNVSIKSPPYLKSYLMMDNIYFLNSNIYGIPENDGKNIKYLYENITNTKLDGVIFINSLGFEKISLKLRKIIWEWQFLNILNFNKPLASKFDTRKKEYLQKSKKFIKKNIYSLLYICLKNYYFLTENNYMQVYHPKHINLLKNIGLLHSYDKNYFYSLDFYFAFKKVNRFLDKKIYINKKIYKNKNRIYLGKNFNGHIGVQYIWNKGLLDDYKRFYTKLEKKYNKKLTYQQREIMGLEGGRDYNLSIFYLPNKHFHSSNLCNKYGNILTCMQYFDNKQKKINIFLDKN